MLLNGLSFGGSVGDICVLVVLATKTQLLFHVDVTLFFSADTMEVHMSVPWLDTTVENLIDLFQGLASGFGKAEEDVDGHGRAEATKDEISLPLDVFLVFN